MNLIGPGASDGVREHPALMNDRQMPPVTIWLHISSKVPPIVQLSTHSMYSSIPPFESRHYESAKYCEINAQRSTCIQLVIERVEKASNDS